MAIRDSHHHCSHFQGNDFIFCAAILCAFLALDASHLLYGYGSKVCATGTLWSRGRTDRLTLSPCSVLIRVLQKPKRLSQSYHKFFRTSVLPFRYSPPYLSAFPSEAGGLFHPPALSIGAVGPCVIPVQQPMSSYNSRSHLSQ